MPCVCACIELKYSPFIGCAQFITYCYLWWDQTSPSEISDPKNSQRISVGLGGKGESSPLVYKPRLLKY